MSQKSNFFENEIKKLENSVNNIENKNLSIEEMLVEFKSGTIAAKKCLEILNNAESQIKLISEEIDNILEESVNDDRKHFERKKESDQ